MELLAEKLAGAHLADVRIGIFYTGVKLSTGHGGVAYTPRGEAVEATCCPRMHGMGPKAGELVNMPLEDALGLSEGDNPLLRAVGIAAVNAASQAILFGGERPNYHVVLGADALDVMEVGPGDTVVMVGAFPPYVRRLKNSVGRLHVFDENSSALQELGLPTSPETPLEGALAEASVAIITGSAFVNRTIDGILQASRAKKVAVVGPTASMLPEPLFKRGVSVLGGVRIDDSDMMLRIISEAGGSRALKTCATKYVVMGDRVLGMLH